MFLIQSLLMLKISGSLVGMQVGGIQYLDIIGELTRCHVGASFIGIGRFRILLVGGGGGGKWGQSPSRHMMS